MLSKLLTTAAIVGFAIAPAMAQSKAPAQTNTPPQANDGARPGNIPGTNNSLPLGNTASNIEPGDTHSSIAPHLPSPPVADNAGPRQYLGAAKQALAAHHSGEAQQALEMAETRALDRSIAPSAANTPDQSPLVVQISHALDALGHRDWAAANHSIDQAMALTNDAMNQPMQPGTNPGASGPGAMPGKSGTSM